MSDLALFDAQPTDAIVGREPGWIVRSGITQIFVVVLILLALTWFIRYPDSIYAKVILTTQLPPVPLVAKTDGRITRLFVADGDVVAKGKPLMLLENSVDYDQLKTLQASLAELSSLQASTLSLSGMGELQPVINQLNFALKELQLFESSAQLSIQISDTKAMSEQYHKLQTQLQNKLDTMKSKLALEARLLATNKTLKQQGLITDAELVVVENGYLDKKLALEDIHIQVELYNIKIKELEQALVKFNTLRDEQKQQLTTRLSNAHAALVSKIDQWQQRYLVTAATSGTVSFANYWSVHQQVKTGDIVVNIVNGSDNKIGKMQLNQQGAGKVKVGQQVYIELDSFPAVEFGKLQGTIQSISLIPGQLGYRVDVTLPEKLSTTYDQVLPFTPNLVGTARVVTQNKRLLQRFLGKVLYLFDNG